MTKGNVIRVVLYALIAACTGIVSEFSKLDAETAQAMYWTQWLVLGIGPLLAALIAVKAFFDQSITTKPPKP